MRLIGEHFETLEVEDAVELAGLATFTLRLRPAGFVVLLDLHVTFSNVSDYKQTRPSCNNLQNRSR